MPRFDQSKLEQFLKLHICALPKHYTSQHGQWITMVQFILCSLDLVHLLNTHINPYLNQQLIDQIYKLQQSNGGFVSAHSLIDADCAATYSALACLITLGDPLERLDRTSLIAWVEQLQNPDGGFRQFIHAPYRSDLRFVYSALATYKFLGVKVTPILRSRVIAYILRNQTYEGGFGLHPLAESHGGYTYCAVASLFILNALNQLPTQNHDCLVRWAVNQQLCGFSGRINKPNDACYSFWIGATLKLLGFFDLIDTTANQLFLTTTQSKFGGFGKNSETLPDVMHTYMTLAAMSFSDTNGEHLSSHGDLASVVPELTISQRAFQKHCSELSSNKI